MWVSIEALMQNFQQHLPGFNVYSLSMLCSIWHNWNICLFHQEEISRATCWIQVVYSDIMWPEVIPSAWILGPRKTAHTVHVWRKRAWQQLKREWGHTGFWVCCFCLARQVHVSQIRCYFKSVGFSSLLFFGSSPSSNRWVMIFWESLINTQQNYFKIMRANLISNP